MKSIIPQPAPVPPSALVLVKATLNSSTALTTATNYNIKTNVAVRLSFNNALDRTSVAAAVSVKENGTVPVPVNYNYENNDSTVVVTASAALKNLTKYTVSAGTGLKSVKGGFLNTNSNLLLLTQIDSSNKFPVISDDALLTLVQQQTFKYFWDFAHPVSGLARERNNSGETVTSGGSGFGMMTIPVAINRSFITRAQGLPVCKRS